MYGMPFLWKRRLVPLGLALVLTSFATAGLVIGSFSVLYVFVGVVSLFRLLNLVRIAEKRMNQWYLLTTTRRTGFILGTIQILLLGLSAWVTLEPGVFVSGLAVVQLVAAVFVLVVSLRNIYKSRHIPVLEHYADRDLPTVTIAIPARNETTDLEQCLKSVLANTYPKLEVLVLDDCSQDRTAEIIRSFAQDGVRFVKGNPPAERWLAKNQAYDKLADEASGELVIFCGVDVRFGPDTVRALVTTMLTRKKDMVSILPRRMSSGTSAAFIQPIRYWWELAFPRRQFNRPPVLSTCWMIRRKTLKSLGGFDAVSHAIIPEGYFARELVKTDTYSFIRADDILDVETRKSLADQQETTIRMRYPQVRRRPEWAMILMVTELLLWLGPFALALSGFWVGLGPLQALAIVTCVLLILTHVLIVQVSNPANVLIALVNFPFAVIAEVVLGLTSMVRYEFSTVDWKGRNVCVPVMHVIPKLPDIEQNP